MGMLERDKREQWRGEYGQCTLYAYTEISWLTPYYVQIIHAEKIKR
jgi:hypothetical protein